MRKLLLLLILLFAVQSANGQATNSSASNPLGGNVNLVDAGTCSTYGTYFWQKLPLNASTTTVNLAGTFSGTVTVRTSNNGGATWTTAGTQTGVGTSSYTTNGFTDVCADVTTYASGIIQLTVTTGVGVNGAASAGVSSLNALTGAVTLAAGANTTITPAGNTLTIASSGSGITQVASLPGTCTAGSQYQITGTNNYFICGPANTFTQVALGAQTSAPPMGFYYTNQCPIANTAFCFYTPSDTQQAVTCSWTTSSATITCTSGPFVPTDVGKRFYGYVSCNAFTGNLVSNASSGAITTGTAYTIATYISATQVTLSANPANAVSLAAGVGGCGIWGHLDDTGAAALSAAVAASTTCPKVFFAAAYYMFSTPPSFMASQPPACAITGGVYGGSLGNLFYAYGYDVEGRGVAVTQIFLTPGFPETGACNSGSGGSACFFEPLEARWADFSITGGMNSQGGNVATNIALLQVVGPASLENFTCLNWGAGNTSLFRTGIQTSNWVQFYQVNNSGCGDVGWDILTASLVTGIKVRIENSPFALSVDGPGFGFEALTCYDCGFYEAQFTNSNAAAANPFVITNRGGNILLYHNNIQSAGNTVTAGVDGYMCTIAGCILKAKESYFNFSTGSSSNNNSSIVCTVACDNYLENTSLTAQSAGNTYKDGVATSRMFDEGGNSGFASGGGVSLTGNVYGSPSTTGTQLVTGNVVLTSGWGTGAAASAFNGSSGSEYWTTTIGTAPSATAVTTVTFPVPFIAGSKVSCSATLANGSSTAILQAQCVATPTTATITYIGTLVSGTVITRLTAAN
jgi:hypothetical protein